MSRRKEREREKEREKEQKRDREIAKISVRMRKYFTYFTRPDGNHDLYIISNIYRCIELYIRK